MEYQRISKAPIEQFSLKPNLRDYSEMRTAFSWKQIAQELDWFSPEQINIAQVAIDTHVKAGQGAKKAFIWESKKGEVEEYPFADMALQSNKSANVLVKEPGLQTGDRVFFFL